MKNSSNEQSVKSGKAYSSPKLVVFGQIASVTEARRMGAFPDGGTMVNMTLTNMAVVS
jgi:hypothetical protein